MPAVVGCPARTQAPTPPPSAADSAKPVIQLVTPIANVAPPSPTMTLLSASSASSGVSLPTALQKSNVCRRKCVHPRRSPPPPGIGRLDVYRHLVEAPHAAMQLARRHRAAQEALGDGDPHRERRAAPSITLRPSRSCASHAAAGPVATTPTLAAAGAPTAGRQSSLPSQFTADERQQLEERDQGWLALVQKPQYSNPAVHTVPKPVQSARGSALKIAPTADGYQLIGDAERMLCSQLRLWPVQYLRVKGIMLSQRESTGYFKKRYAQKLCRIDINKTNKIYDWFIDLGWLLPDPF